MKNTFYEWIHILKFKKHCVISDGTRNYESTLFTIQSPNKDYLKLEQTNYNYLFLNVWFNSENEVD